MGEGEGEGRWARFPSSPAMFDGTRHMQVAAPRADGLGEEPHAASDSLVRPTPASVARNAELLVGRHGLSAHGVRPDGEEGREAVRKASIASSHSTSPMFSLPVVSSQS